MSEAPAQRVTLVTGSNGMLGRHIQDIVAKEGHSSKGSWFFASSKDADLRDAQQTKALFDKVKPTHVIHCAARLASIQEMTTRPVDFWNDNVSLNNNVLAAAHSHKARLVSVLSSVMFAKDTQFPVIGTPDELWGGQLHEAAESYGLAKRALAQLTKWYRKQHGAQFSCILPGNFFGPYGDFDGRTAPLVNALVSKAIAAKEKSEAMSVMGTGKPLRQIMYTADLARIMVWAVDNFDDELPLIAAGPEVSVKEVAELAAQSAGFTGPIEFDVNGVDGPLRRTADMARFEKFNPDFAFTPLAEGIKVTVDWYLKNRGK